MKNQIGVDIGMDIEVAMNYIKEDMLKISLETENIAINQSLVDERTKMIKEWKQEEEKRYEEFRKWCKENIGEF